MTKTAAKSFKATLERLQGESASLKWVIARIPFDVRKLWGTGGRFKVKGDINGFAFRTSLFPVRGGSHFLLVNKQMQAGAKAALGAVARFRLEPDTEERKVTVPAELNRLLSEDRAFRRWFDQLNYSIRKYLADGITSVKSPEARVRRAEQTAENLLAAMEAEHELPPVLQVAFAHNPHAFQGWKRMSPRQRRQHLLGIFYYRSPEARARRIAKAMQDAVRYADKSPRKEDTA